MLRRHDTPVAVVAARNACGVCTRTRLGRAAGEDRAPRAHSSLRPGPARAGAPPPSSRATVTAVCIISAPGQRPGGVVDQHHVDCAGFDVSGEVAQDIEFRGVTAVAALDEFHPGARKFPPQRVIGQPVRHAGRPAPPERCREPARYKASDHDAIDRPPSRRYALLPSAPTRVPMPAASTTPAALRVLRTCLR